MRIVTGSNTNREIISSEWFSSIQATIGIVAVKKDKGWKAFIGLCSGQDRKFDEKYIADLGTPIRKDIAEAIFPQIKIKYIY